MQDFLNFVGQTNPQLAQKINASDHLEMAVALIGVQRTRSQELESLGIKSNTHSVQEIAKQTILNDGISQKAATLLNEILSDPQVNQTDFLALLDTYEKFIPLQQSQQNNSQEINPEKLKEILEAAQALQDLRKGEEKASIIDIAKAALDLKNASQGL